MDLHVALDEGDVGKALGFREVLGQLEHLC
jgi:hypothetical protein